MKLYASSFRLGSEPGKLRSLFSRGTRVGVIPNALDFSTDLQRRQRAIEREFHDLASLGLAAEELDLRDCFGQQEALGHRLDRCDGVWVIGGNSFLLRRAMRYSGFDVLLDQMRTQTRDFVYAGYSAGACVLAPTLRGIELVDPPDVVPDGYAPEIVWEGLGFLDYSIAPHFRSDHPESPLMEAVVDYFIQHGMSYRTLADGEAIVAETVAEASS